MSGRTYDDFDPFAKDYREVHSKNVQLTGADSYYFAEHKVLQLRNHETNAPLYVLDIGCGDGVVERYMHQYFPAWKLTGIDVSPASIAIARQQGLAQASFTIYDGRHLDFDAESFDLVFIAAVLHHVDRKLHPALVKEAYRVLQPGGRLYLFEHNPINPVTRYLVRTCVFDKDAQLLGHNYSQRLLREAGFGKIGKTFMLFFPRNKIFNWLLKLEDKLGWLPLGGQYMVRGIK